MCVCVCVCVCVSECLCACVGRYWLYCNNTFPILSQYPLWFNIIQVPIFISLQGYKVLSVTKSISISNNKKRSVYIRIFPIYIWHWPVKLEGIKILCFTLEITFCKIPSSLMLMSNQLNRTNTKFKNVRCHKLWKSHMILLSIIINRPTLVKIIEFSYIVALNLNLLLVKKHIFI